MAHFWRRIAAFFSAGRLRRSRVPLKERFSHFLSLCAANDAFLGRLSQMMELAENHRLVGMDTVHAGYETLEDAIETMVSSLLAMAPGRYRDLPSRFGAIEQEVARDVLKARPIEALAFVIFPGDPEAEKPEVVGGKAAHLGRLSAQGEFIVPPFFTVTAHAYHHFLEATGVQERIHELLWSADFQDMQRLKHACEEIRREILRAEPPAGFAETIVGAYRKLRTLTRADFGLAVRSSATVEDAEFSFAGQFESVLGANEDELFDAYKRVVASKYRLEAVRYAGLSGFLDEEVAMPVLFMAMLQPAASGVAYSRDPEGGEDVIVTAVRGLAQALVDGRITPDRYVLRREPPHDITERIVASKEMILRCSERGGILEVPLLDQNKEAISPDMVSTVARLALRLEAHFGEPQDVEWAVDQTGIVYVVQSRLLHQRNEESRPDAAGSLVEGYRVLVSGGTRACGGVAHGEVMVLIDFDHLDVVKEGVILVVPTTSPRLAAVVGRVSAIVADAGSSTGHMATVAREFKLPTLVGVEKATAVLRDGMHVTVDAWSGKIFEGEVVELLSQKKEATKEPLGRDAAKECLKRLIQRVAPLMLEDPGSPNFSVENCTTLHDIARFVHQKAMAEMFQTESLSPSEKREARRLRWSVPMDVFVMDLGGGVAPESKSVLELPDIRSAPFLALIEGMTDPRLRWAGPVGFDLKGFMSVVVRSAADDQRYGEPSFGICSREYVHFSSRLAYHFATVDAMCSTSDNQNYARFLFFGGAAVAERREWRAHFLATVLKVNGFDVNRVGDRVEAILGKRSAVDIEEALVLLGRLMAATRHLDMVMDSQSTAESYATAFLSGDFSFEFVRKRLQ